MINDLKNSIIFLHGLSGSGKGEIQRQITEKYSSNGYDVVYGSSGDLLRAGFSDPYIRTRLLSGYYFDTLEPIVPGLKAIFKEFITKWGENDKKAVLILDGVIRRTEFVNSEGKQIPSQINQVAQCLEDVLAGLTKDDPSLLKDFSEYEEKMEVDERVRKVTMVLKDAIHTITDVRPEDAENQMKARASKEMQSIKRQLVELSMQGLLPEDIARTVAVQTKAIEEIIGGSYSAPREEIIYNPDLPEESAMPITVDLNIILHHAKDELAKSVGVEGESTTLSSIYKALGVITAIREDDITHLGRNNRINNFVRRSTEGSMMVYEPGFAAIALTKDLGFDLTQNISFESTRPNCYVVENGQSKGITLEQFRQESSKLAGQLFIQTERERLIAKEGNEGFRRSKER